MSKIIGYTALRYGKDYFGYAIRSAINLLDEYHVLYAEQPSHGHYSSAICPDTEDELHAIAWQAAGTKLRWHRGSWVYENEQRNAIYQYAQQAIAILSIDSDEIYSERLIESIEDYIRENAFTPSVPMYTRIPFIHYWRSFRRCVLGDPAYPARLIFPMTSNGAEATWDISKGMVNHMGYATLPEIMAYKWQIHGHKDELRTDINWFKDVFMANRQFDCHPVGSQYWNPERVEPLQFMPYWMTSHPFFNMGVIE